MQKCKLCKIGEEFYKSSPHQWHFNVCKQCCRKEYSRQKLYVPELRKNAPDKALVCFRCGENKILRHYPDSEVASAMIGFPCKCRECLNEKERKSRRNKKIKAIVAELI